MTSIRTLLLALVTALGTPLVSASDWTGLWRLSRHFEGRVEAVYHLHIAEGETPPILYANDARPMILQQHVLQGAALELKVANSAKQPLPLLFQLKLEGGQLSGQWFFSQMQLAQPLTGSVTGHRVSGNAVWEPWAALETARKSGRTLDLAHLVREKAPRKKFEKFELFFTTEIELPYYFLLHERLYGERGPEQRESLLRRLFEQLQKPPRPSANFTEITQRVLERLDSAAPAAVLPYFVSLPFSAAAEPSEAWLWTRIPTAADEQACACKLDLRESFISVNPLSYHDIARLEADLLAQSLWQYPASTLGVEIFRRGLALSMLVPDWESHIQKESESSGLETKRLRVPADGSADFPLDRPWQEIPAYLTGLSLISRLQADNSQADLLSWPDHRVMQAWAGSAEKPARRRPAPRRKPRRRP